MPDLVPLPHVSPGGIAQIGLLMGDPHQVQRLEELGLRVGAMIQMIQSGSPCIVQLSGNRLCFRPSESLCVLVRRGISA